MQQGILTVIYICFSICISSAEFNQNQCQYNCNNTHYSPCCIKDELLKLKKISSYSTWINQVNETVAKNITSLNLHDIYSEIEIPGNLSEEFPNLKSLKIINGKLQNEACIFIRRPRGFRTYCKRRSTRHKHG